MNNSQKTPKKSLTKGPKRSGHETDRPGVRCSKCKNRGHIADKCPSSKPSSEDVVNKALSEAAQQQLGAADAKNQALQEQIDSLTDKKTAQEEEISDKTKFYAKTALQQKLVIKAPSGKIVEGLNVNLVQFEKELVDAMAEKDRKTRKLFYMVTFLTFLLAYIFLSTRNPSFSAIEQIFKVNELFPFLGLLSSVSWIWKAFSLSFLVRQSNPIKFIVLNSLTFLEWTIRFLLKGACYQIGFPIDAVTVIVESWFGSYLYLVLLINYWFFLITVISMYAHRKKMHATIKMHLNFITRRDPFESDKFLHSDKWYTDLFDHGYFQIYDEEEHYLKDYGLFSSSRYMETQYKSLPFMVKVCFIFWFLPFTWLTIFSAWWTDTPVFIYQSRFVRKRVAVRDQGLRLPLFKMKRIKRVITITPPRDSVQLLDLRPDNMAFSKLKHVDPIYSAFRSTYLTPDNVEWPEQGDDRVGTMSLELFMQLTTPSIVNLIDDVDSIKFRLNRSAQNFHGVNVDKYQVLFGEDIVNNTIDCVFHFYRYRKNVVRKSHFDELFCQPQSK